MTRWDYDSYTEDENPEEEARLIKKFNDYLDLEKSEKIRKEMNENNSIKRILKKPFVVMALIEGTILIGLASAFMILLNHQ